MEIAVDTRSNPGVWLIVDEDGTVHQIDDWPESPAEACLEASLPVLKRLWDTPEDDEAWKDL
jgi:hypothetical protein